MKIRTAMMALLAIGALVSGTAATVTVTGQLAKSNGGASAAKRQYCPPQSGHGKGKGNNHGKGKKCGQGGQGGKHGHGGKGGHGGQNRCGNGFYPGENSPDPHTRAQVRSQKGRDRAHCAAIEARRDGQEGGARGRQTAQDRINRGMHH